MINKIIQKKLSNKIVKLKWKKNQAKLNYPMNINKLLISNKLIIKKNTYQALNQEKKIQ